jgi:hypothetical protein
MCPLGSGDNELKEVPVADEQIVEPTAVDVPSSTGQGQKRWVDEQFLVAVRLGR